MVVQMKRAALRIIVSSRLAVGYYPELFDYSAGHETVNHEGRLVVVVLLIQLRTPSGIQPGYNKTLLCSGLAEKCHETGVEGELDIHYTFDDSYENNVNPNSHVPLQLFQMRQEKVLEYADKVVAADQFYIGACSLFNSTFRLMLESTRSVYGSDLRTLLSYTPQ